MPPPPLPSPSPPLPPPARTKWSAEVTQFCSDWLVARGAGWAVASMAIAAAAATAAACCCAAATAAAPLLLLRCCCRRRCCHCGLPHCHRHAATTAAPTTHLGFTLQFFPWQMRRSIVVASVCVCVCVYIYIYIILCEPTCVGTLKFSKSLLQ